MSEQRDKNLWIFNAGNSFAGNPKWMFEYIIRHHKEIKPVWMCYNADTMNYVHKLGYEAELYRSSKGKDVMKKPVSMLSRCVKRYSSGTRWHYRFESVAHGVGWQEYRKKG